MSEKILLVDDEPRVLSGLRRQLRNHYNVDTASGGAHGLEIIRKHGPFAVVVSDMRMPDMDGVQFLRRVNEAAPDTVRLMLTGNADLKTAIEAVNRGHVFRFLCKPCPPQALQDALRDALRQYELVTTERLLLEKTLSGSVQVLSELLSLIDPRYFNLSQGLTDLVESVGTELGVERPWELRVATMLLRMGNVAVPPTLLSKASQGEPLSEDERAVLERVPEVGRDLLRKIPRLEGVAEIVFYQAKHFDGTGFPVNAVKGRAIPLGARILKVAVDLATLEISPGQAGLFETLQARVGWYDPMVLEATRAIYQRRRDAASSDHAPPVLPVTVDDLRIGDLLVSEIRTGDGKLLIASGHRVSPTILARIRNFSRFTSISEPIHVAARDRCSDRVAEREVVSN